MKHNLITVKYPNLKIQTKDVKISRVFVEEFFSLFFHFSVKKIDFEKALSTFAGYGYIQINLRLLFCLPMNRN